MYDFKDSILLYTGFTMCLHLEKWKNSASIKTLFWNPFEFDSAQ